MTILLCDFHINVPPSLRVGGETSYPQAEEGVNVTGKELSLLMFCLPIRCGNAAAHFHMADISNLGV
jgi:hypothetical protein